MQFFFFFFKNLGYFEKWYFSRFKKKGIFLGFLLIFGFFHLLFIVLDILDFFYFGFFLFSSGFFSKSLRLLLKVTEIITGHQKWLKMGQNSILSSFFCLKGKKKLKPSAGAKSRPAYIWSYLLGLHNT